MTHREVFDPTEFEHDIRLKPGIRLTAEPKDYGHIFYWIYIESEETGQQIQVGLITQEEYDWGFDMDPERNG